MADDLEIDEHRAFQKRFWRAQRVGWGLLSVVIVLSIAGMTGAGGFWASTTIAGENAAIVAPRVLRAGAAETFAIQVKAASPTLDIGVDRAFVGSFHDVEFFPLPASMRNGPNGMTGRFDTYPGQTTEFLIRATPHAVGLRTVEIRVSDSPLSFDILVLP